MQINNNILHSIDLKENRMTLKRIGKQVPNQLSSNLNIFKDPNPIAKFENKPLKF